MSEPRMSHGLLLKKEGMTRIFYDKGFIPVTVLTFLKTRILEVKGKKAKILTEVTSSENIKRVNKPERGSLLKFAKNDAEKAEFEQIERAIIKEVDTYTEVETGLCDLTQVLQEGQFVDIQGKSIGKGFSGVMKRWNFKGLRASHGVSVSHRSQGSTGQRQDPGRVMKGKKMAGRLGFDTTTVQNLKVVKIMPEHNIVLVKGSIPGPEKSIVFVKKAVKK